MKSYDGKYTIFKEEFAWIMGHPGRGGIRHMFADPSNIWERYTKVEGTSNEPDDNLKRLRVEIFDRLYEKSRHKLRVFPHIGGNLPPSNTLETINNNTPPSHAETIQGDTIVRADIETWPRVTYDLLESEYVQGLLGVVERRGGAEGIPI